MNAFGNALGESLASQSQRQGEGPWSSKDYVNGADLESDQAYSRRVLADAMAGPGISESDYWNSPGRTVADLYAETYGGVVQEVSASTDRLKAMGLQRLGVRGPATRGDEEGQIQWNTREGDYRTLIEDGQRILYGPKSAEVASTRSVSVNIKTLSDLPALPALTAANIEPLDLGNVANSLAYLPSTAPTWQEGLQASNDAGVIAGTYGKFGAAADAARAGNWDQAWFHLNYAASDQARAAAYARVNPSPDPRFALIDAARNGPMGAMTALAYRNASPQEQIYASQAATHIDTLIAPGRQRASVSGSRVRQSPGMPPLQNDPIGRRGRLEFQGLEVRAVRDLDHVSVGTLRAMSRYGFAAKDINGNALILHHHQQNPAGPIIEMPGVNHSIWNRAQHPFGNAPGAGLTPEQRADFDKWRVDYWKWRATQELNKRGIE